MRPLTLLLFSVPMVVSAQAPVRYRYTNTSPNVTATFDGGVTSRMISVNKTVAILSVTTRDSAGMKLFDITGDSTFISQVLTDSTAEAKARWDMRAADPSPRATPGSKYQIVLRNGTPALYGTARGAVAIRLDTVSVANPWQSLVTKSSGVGLIVANPRLPGTIGTVVADTFYSHSLSEPLTVSIPGGSAATTLPSIESFDSTIVIWKRVSADIIEGEVTQRSTRSSPAMNSVGTAKGLYRLVLDANRELREASVSLDRSTTSTQAAGTRPPQISMSKVTYSLTRMP